MNARDIYNWLEANWSTTRNGQPWPVRFKSWIDKINASAYNTAHLDSEIVTAAAAFAKARKIPVRKFKAQIKEILTA